MEEPNVKYISKEEIRSIDPSQIVSIRMNSGSVLILKQGNNQEEKDLKKENKFNSNACIATRNNSSLYIQEGVGEPCKHCGKSYRIFEVNSQDYANDSQKNQEKEKIEKKEELGQSNEQIEEKKENGEKMEKKVEIEAQCPHEEKKEVLKGVDGKPLLNDILTGEEFVGQENKKMPLDYSEQKPSEKIVDNNFEQQEQEINQNEINKSGEEQNGQDAKEEMDQNEYQEQEQFQYQEEYNEQEQQPEYPPEQINNENIPEQQPEYHPEEINNENKPEQQVENVPQEINNENIPEQQVENLTQEINNENKPEQQVENLPPEINNENKNEEHANDENLNDKEQNQQDYHHKEIEQDVEYQKNEKSSEKEKGEINPPKLNDEDNQQNLEAEYQQPENQIQKDNKKEKNVEIQPPKQQAIKPQIQQSIELTMAQANKQKINILPKQFPGKKYIGRGFVPSQRDYNKGINMTYTGRIRAGFHNIYGSNRMQGRNITRPIGNKGAYSHTGYFRPCQKKLINCKRMFTPLGTIENMALIQGAIYPKTYIPSRRIGLQSANSGAARREDAYFDNQKRVLCPECAALEYENSYQYNYIEYNNNDKALNIDEDKNKYCSQTYQAKTKYFTQNYKFNEIVETSDNTKTHVVVKKGGVIVSSDK